MADTIPADYRKIERTSAFSSLIGPLYETDRTAPDYRVGILLEEKHRNLIDVVHGGLLASLSDTYLGRLIVFGARENIKVLTVSLTVDYLSAGRIGEFVEAKGQVDRRGRGLCHSSGGLFVGDRQLVRAHAIYKVLYPKSS